MVSRDMLPGQSSASELGADIASYMDKVKEEYEELLGVVKGLFSLNSASFIHLKGAISLQGKGEEAIRNASRKDAIYVPLEPIFHEEYVYFAKNNDKGSDAKKDNLLVRGEQIELTQFLYPMSGAYWLLSQCQTFGRGNPVYKLMKWNEKPVGIFTTYIESMKGYKYQDGRSTRKYLNRPIMQTVSTTEPLDLANLVKEGGWERARDYGPQRLLGAKWSDDYERISNLNADGAWMIAPNNEAEVASTGQKYRIIPLADQKEKVQVKDGKYRREPLYKYQLSEASLYNLNNLGCHDITRHYSTWRRDQYIKNNSKGFGFHDDDAIHPPKLTKIPPGHVYVLPKNIRTAKATPKKDWAKKKTPAKDRNWIRGWNDAYSPTAYLQFKQNYGILNQPII